MYLCLILNKVEYYKGKQEKLDLYILHYTNFLLQKLQIRGNSGGDREQEEKFYYYPLV